MAETGIYRAMGVTPEVTPTGYNDEEYRRVIQGLRPRSSEAVNATVSYLNSLNPTNLLERYKYLDQQVGQGDITDYLHRTYDVATADDVQNFAAYRSAKDMLGRDITQNEFASLLPKFRDGPDTGRAYLAELADQEKNSPAALKAKAGAYGGEVGGLFDRLLGRGATDSEKDYFGRLLASEELSPYQVENMIKATSEYQGNEDKKFRTGLSDELAGYNTEAFDKAKENVLSRYKKAGSGVGQSSDLDFAIAEAMKELETGKNQFLSGISAQQYGGNKAAARSDYEGMVNNYIRGKEADTNRSNSLLDYYMQRADSGADYERQTQDMMDFLAKQPKQKKKSGWGSAVGTLLGAGLAIPTGGLSMGAGAMLGGAGGSLWDELLA